MFNKSVGSRWWFIQRHWRQNLVGCALAMLIRPLAFPRIFRARLRWTWNRGFSPVKTLHGFTAYSIQEFLSYWEMFIERALVGRWEQTIKERAFPIVVDVGANRGVFVRYVRRLNQQAKVHCFEPQQQMIHSLTMAGAYTIRGVALSNKRGRTTMFMSGECAHMKEGFARETTGKIDADVRRLDDFEFLHIDLLKIDVDGHTLEVLEGAQKTLKITRALIIEVMDDDELARIKALIPEFPIVRKLDRINYEFSRE